MNQRVMLTKRLIRESLVELLKTTDIYHVTVKEICANSGINRSTFYAHYDNPMGVLLEIERDTAKDILNIGKVRHINELKKHLEMVFEYMYEHKDLQKIIMTNNSDDDVYSTLADSTFGFTMPEPYLKMDGNKGKEDVMIQAVFLTSGIYNVLKKWIIDDIDKNPVEIADVVYEMIAKQL
ncbi:MAG: TetR family transcriptional regulator C-terminal domain-containing protein [Lachnospiraceae bacterium]|nr:TetR family transcriptional regulator C-terminal domain-containing protein [Lachnospiraceae bacterium]